MSNVPPNDLRVCDYCGAMFVGKQYAQRFCSRECSIPANNARAWERRRKPRVASNCKRCGASLEHKKAHALYCSKTCVSMDHAFNRRRGTRTTAKARRWEIITRDDSACYLCGVGLTYEQVELDHLIPVAQGGGNEPENLAVACGPCNKSRGARLTIRQIIKRNQNRGVNCPL